MYFHLNHLSLAWDATDLSQYLFMKEKVIFVDH